MISLSSQKILRNFVTRGLVGFFIFSNVIDMEGSIGIKYGSSFLLLAYLSFNWRGLNFSYGEVLSILIFAIFFPLLSLFMGLSKGASTEFLFTPLPIILSFTLVFLALKLMPGTHIISYLFMSLYLLALTVIVANFLAFFFPTIFSDINPLLKYIFANIDLYQGTRTDALVGKVYPRAALFFVPAGIYYFLMGNNFRFFVLLTALILVVSKSGALILLGFTLLRVQKRFIFSFQSILVVSAFAALAAVISSIYPNYFDVVMAMFVGQSETADLRIKHLVSLLNHFDNNPLSLIFGQGIGTSFFTFGTNAFEMNIELDHLETIRRYGLIWGSVFYSAIVITSFSLVFLSQHRSDKAIGLALLAGFLAAGTNPVLISPPFMILLVGAYGAMVLANSSKAKHHLSVK